MSPLPTRRPRSAIAAALLLSVAVLAGCAAPADPSAMTVSAATTPITRKHAQSVSVQAAGGNETGLMDSSNVADADLKAAIEASIAQTGVFSRVVQGKGADYELTVSIVSLAKPLIGFTFTVDMETAWVLVKASDRSIVMRKTFRASHSATVGDAFPAVVRLRLAVEGATRKNIEQGLQAISALDF